MEGSRSRRTRAAVAAACCALVAAMFAVAGPSPSTADTVPGGQLVSETAAAGTPHVLDGRVLSVVQVGNTVILGGTFTRARNDSSATELTRRGLLAFDATTGQISTTFVPNPNGTVQVVLPSGDGSTVYVGGSFTSIGGTSRQRVARISVANGSVVSAFNAGAVTGQVRDLRLSAGRLWVAGAFTHVNGRAQRGLTTLNPTTGASLTYMALQVAGTHRAGVGVTQVLKIDITPDGSRLVAIGNFDTLAGVRNHQLFMLDLTGTTARPAGFRTAFYTSGCSTSFDTYMRDVDISTDGMFFVVVTTGAYGGSTAACDTAARFEVASTGADVRPSWVDYTGGDTSHSVEVTADAVYVGGHQRWWNNPFAGDSPGPGAVSREGIAALSAVNGLPFSWDPTRTKGVGVFDFLMTSQGLWVASDTDRIGNWQYKARIARLLRNGTTYPTVTVPTLPGSVYAGGPAGLTRRAHDGTSPGPAQPVGTGGLDWGTVRGSFMINGWLYLARSDGSFTRRTFDGTTYGPVVAVDTADEITNLAAWHTDISSMTGMFYDRGRIYFTRTGSDELSYRYFNPESDVVGAARLVASGRTGDFVPSQVRGMFTTGSFLYWATGSGELRRIWWAQTPQAGFPSGAATVVGGPGVDGVEWDAGTLFLAQHSPGG